MLKTFIPALALGLAACAALPPVEQATLPPGTVQGAGDPVRSAISAASGAFDLGGRLRGSPAEAARTLAALEFLAVNVDRNPALTEPMPMLPVQFAAARAEWRRAFGIAEALPAQAAVNELSLAARAMEEGGPAPPRFTAARAALPQTAQAAAMAAQSLLPERSTPIRL